MTRIMILKMIIPDIATDKDPQGNPVILGSILGRGIEVPFVNCPMKDETNRTALQECFGCPHFHDTNNYYVDCDYITTNKEPHPTADITPSEKTIKTIRKEPDGVYRPTMKE